MKKTKSRPGASPAGTAAVVPGNAGSSAAGPPERKLTPEERYKLIAEAAYRRAEQRGFEGGDPVDDWLEAEREIDGRDSARARPPGARRRSS